MLLTNTHTHTGLYTACVYHGDIGTGCLLLSMLGSSSPSPIGTQWNNHDNFAFMYYLSSGRMKGLHKLWVPLWCRLVSGAAISVVYSAPSPTDRPPRDHNWTSRCAALRGGPGLRASCRLPGRRGQLPEGLGGCSAFAVGQGLQTWGEGEGILNCNFSVETGMLNGRWRNILGSGKVNLQNVGVA